MKLSKSFILSFSLIVIANLTSACSQVKEVDFDAEAEAWYREVQAGRGNEGACEPNNFLAGDVEVESGNFITANSGNVLYDNPPYQGLPGQKATVYLSILSNEEEDMYVYRWKTDDAKESIEHFRLMFGLEHKEVSNNPECFRLSHDRLF
jgi:hypothetical protein